MIVFRRKIFKYSANYKKLSLPPKKRVNIHSRLPPFGSWKIAELSAKRTKEWLRKSILRMFFHERRRSSVSSKKFQSEERRREEIKNRLRKYTDSA